MPENIHAIRVREALASSPEPIRARVKWLPGTRSVAVYFLDRPLVRATRDRAKLRITVAGYEVRSYRPGRGFVEPRLSVKPRDDEASRNSSEGTEPGR